MTYPIEVLQERIRHLRNRLNVYQHFDNHIQIKITSDKISSLQKAVKVIKENKVVVN